MSDTIYVSVIAVVVGFSIVYTAFEYVSNRFQDAKKNDDNSNILIMCMNEKDYNEFRKGNVWITALDDV